MTNSYAIADTDQNGLQSTLQWPALSLTPGIGASRGRKLIELFDGVDRLFTASLTELKAARTPCLLRPKPCPR